MKFSRAKYWKHKDCMNVFFSAYRVQYDDGKKAVLKGTWCTQGMHNWWFTVPYKLTIREQYDNWMPYAPKGDPKL